MFVWTHLAYTTLRIGNAGMHKLPNETALLEGLQKNIGEKSGVYIFPSLRLDQTSAIPRDEPVTDRLSEKVARYPSGILMYNAAGSRPIEMFRWLWIEFLTELAEAFTAVFLLSRTRLASYPARVGFIVLVGLVAAIATNVPHWNWYGFSATYIVPYMLIQLAGFLCLGVVAAFVLRKTSFVAAKPEMLQEASIHNYK
jgi:hypothetical protein